MTGPGCGWSKISRVQAPYDNLGPAVKPLQSPESAVYIMDSLLAGDFKDCEWIYRFGANPGMPRGGVLPPTPVLAPEPALGSRPRVALSSAQAGAMYCRPGPAGNPRLDQVLNHGRNNSTGTASPQRDRLPGPSPRGELPARCGVQCSR